jgi:hypothetical protein
MSQELGMEFKQCTKNVGGEGSKKNDAKNIEFNHNNMNGNATR